MILHVDMDAFFASVEERDNPSLRGKPVIVGGTAEGRGVVAAANYEVRKAGVHSAMPTAKALRLCPSAIVIRPRKARYVEVSQGIREIFHRYTSIVEPLALDEAFLDVRDAVRQHGKAIEIGQRIKQDIFREQDLIASVGVAQNKFLAKLASDLEKPDGLVQIHDSDVQSILDPLPVSRIWGIGKVTARRFHELGVRTISDLRKQGEDFLLKTFGSQGQLFWNLAHGIDHRAVEPNRETKSISSETTFSKDIAEIGELLECLADLTESVARRLQKSQLCGRTVQLKLRYADFHTITRSHSIKFSTDSAAEILSIGRRMLATQLPDRPLVVRLLGIGVSGLQKSTLRQRGLFDHLPDERE